MTARSSRRPPPLLPVPVRTNSRILPADSNALLWGTGRVAVLGVDPGTWHIGLVALGWDGTLLDWLRWDIPARTGTEDRLILLREGLQLAIRELRPSAVAYEFGTGQYQAAALDIVLARIPAWCDAVGVPSAGYRPSSWRKTVCGNGGLDKAGAWDAMQIGYPAFRTIPATAGDARDAFGVGQCWLDRNRSELAKALAEPGARMVRYGRKKVGTVAR